MQNKPTIKLRNYTQVVYWRFMILPHFFDGGIWEGTRGNFKFFSDLQIALDTKEPGVQDATTDKNTVFDLKRILNYELNECIILGKLSLIAFKLSKDQEILKSIFKFGAYAKEIIWDIELLQNYLVELQKKNQLKDMVDGVQFFIDNTDKLELYNKTRFDKTKAGDELDDISKILKSANNTITEDPIIKQSLDDGYEPKDILRIKQYIKKAGSVEKAPEYIIKNWLPLFKDKHKVQRRANAAIHLGHQNIAKAFIDNLAIMENLVVKFSDWVLVN